MNGDDEDDWDDFDESLPKDVAYPFSDEDWTLFIWAVGRIQSDLLLSTGEAEKTLRGLCADGTVRSVRRQYSDDKPVGPAAIIRPSEWVKDHIDFEVTDETFIGVSEDDLKHWLDKQEPELEKALRNPDLRKQAIKALWPDGEPIWSDQPELRQWEMEKAHKRVRDYLRQQLREDEVLTPARKPELSAKSSRKRDLVPQAINALWPTGAPDTRKASRRVDCGSL
jgi:hypothetical protein